MTLETRERDTLTPETGEVTSNATVDLSRFCNADFDRGAGRIKEASWLLLRRLFFGGSLFSGYALRRAILRRFGACVDPGVVIKPRVQITFPWRLRIGANSWLGEECYILNLAPVTIGANVCVSQRAFLCTGSHDWSDATFRLITKPIHVEDGAWICANAFVSPGVTVGRNAVILAGSVVTQDMPADMICQGNPCRPIKRRHIRGSPLPEMA
jgi:putative colanic acid biosynthesis acetyltransferase WcaF